MQKYGPPQRWIKLMETIYGTHVDLGVQSIASEHRNYNLGLLPGSLPILNSAGFRIYKRVWIF